MITGIDARLAHETSQGVGVYAMELIHALVSLSSAEHRFILYTYPEYQEKWEISANVDVHASPRKFSYGFWTQWILPVMVKKHPPDILLNPLSAFPLRVKIPQCSILYDFAWIVSPGDYGRIDRIKHHVWMKIICGRKNPVVAISNQVRDHFLRLDTKGLRDIRTIYSGISPVFLNNKEIFANNNVPYFLCPGGASLPRKNFENAVAGMEVLRLKTGRNVELIVTGRIHEVYRDLVRRCSWIKNAGVVPLSLLASYYAGSTAVLYPSPYEGFGMPVLEAFASRTAVISCSIPAVDEIVPDAVYKADPFSPEDIAEKSLQVMESPEERTLKITSGRNRVSFMTWEKTAEAYLKFFKTVYRDPSPHFRV